ncbi:MULTISPECIES: ThiF family adenylyltransferase [unclassified Oceanispirochaeta]|uniref:tRNA threonylcarbamoyladenosine dehydratase n=1 Tax=unclassified Oceanispirochaeta TaxID=2635722 RepID=UPI000E08FF3C|nr:MULTISPECIES: tRNA threonylcarbamoyladenosine dehydratase [unclassified Oceanispirochaeta]MBF9017019.1 tRNA threonylcarbamoyladenosine dehydratase [Oceanispirochaeta sp. M2]NPD73468.1 tRNA threonylcarbamoyladenosine dehydratase [Oceanispirochaeta sp. M1]RDG30761.1 tRNA threonylcarbamoyladenosine dehydratase [Oceanispirochaeta sp. M1]
MERFLRIDRLIGREKRESLAEKRACIVGLGAVGGYALEALARSGVGYFTLVDFDTVNLTNINRQLLALESTIGESKVELARRRILDINPQCKVSALNIFAHDESMEQIFSEKPDVLIDAIDSMAPKLTLLEYAWNRGIPIVSSMGAAVHTDPFSIRCSDLMKTHTCPLARQIRKKLRRRGVGKGITCLYSAETVEYDYKDPEEEENPDRNEQVLDRGRKRKVLGSLPTITGIFGLQIGHCALEKLLGGSFR